MLLCIIYLFFACFYVLLCQRNNNVISLFGNTISVNPKTVISPSTKTKSSLKFFSRPRVVANRLSNPGSILAAIFCLLFSTAALTIYKPYFNYKASHFYLKYSLCYLYVWRI